MEHQIQDKLPQDQHQAQVQRAWWNRPLWGNQSFVEWFSSIWQNGVNLGFTKEEIPSSTVELYRNLYSQLKNVAAIARTIDNEKFSSREFVNFLNINAQINQNTGAYQGLKQSIELLRVALETKDSFLKIEATETRYRGYAQQEFYEYIYQLLAKNLNGDKFRESAQTELVEVIPKIKTEEGKAAIQSYVNQLEILSENELGLKLLFLFKQYDLSNFALLRTVAEIADSFYDKNLENIKEFMVVVQINVDLFLKLGQIIQVPQAKNVPETYALILQYIALRHRHQNSFGQFQQLLTLLKNWVNLYNPLATIRTEYPPEQYQQPKLFEEEIPGLFLYNKYQRYLNSL
jgi:hypothetical protein